VKKRSVCAIVTAAGNSSRMGGISKILTPINGLPLIGHTLRALENCGAIDEIIAVAREEDIESIADLCGDLNITKISRVLRGGDTRSHSVMIALMEAKADIIAIHDGARPCVSPELCESVINAAIKTGAAIPAIPFTDTAKSVSDAVIKTTVDRSALYTVQTPQCFDAGLIKGALAKALNEGHVLTDDSSAVEALPYPVHIVPGEARNIKVTTPDDLIIVSALLKDGAI
jgi:2-C-methyl-D-erythritol 4-phosphate cytidylyltransferase